MKWRRPISAISSPPSRTSRTGANDWFSKRIQILNEQLAQAQNAAVAYRKSNQVMLAGGKYVDEQQVVEISARLTAARNERAQTEIEARAHR